ncbi:MAG: hypothetical protein J0I30_11280 [Burkholderiales bacterium]|nr:hypothetical protein [Burkholderiales bacterium]
MAALSDFERFVLPFCVGAPMPAVHDAVLDASIEFCTLTRAAREFSDLMTLDPGVAEYEIDPPDGDSQVTEVLAAWLPEGQIDPITRLGLDLVYRQGWTDLTVGTTAEVRRYYCRLPGLIRLVPALSARVPRVLRVEFAYAPTRTATSVPDILLSRYAEQIRDGALARLHQHAAQYADPQRAVLYGQLFEHHCAMRADESQHGFSHQPLRTGLDEF